MQTIYEPKGKAKEYSEEIKGEFYSNLALNIYKGCNHNCIYCYVPAVLRKTREEFHSCVEPRDNIVEETKKRLAKGDIVGKTIFLSFTSDPFPISCDHTPTYEIIKAIKDSGNFVRILTKGDPNLLELREYLTKDDIFGVTISCGTEKAEEVEPNAAKVWVRLQSLRTIKEYTGCKTFVSCEPVYEPEIIYELIERCNYINEYKIGKLNYAPSDINWGEFGRECERLCIEHNRKYMIKADLRKLM